MTINNGFLKEIIDANNDDKLAIFVGAGVSLSTNTATSKMPSWGDIIDQIRAQINENKETDYLKIAQYYYNNLGKDNYYKKLFEMFPHDLKSSNIHECIFDINPNIIITTNWDDFLEQENHNNARFYDVIATDRELVKSVKPHKIIKMHGDFIHNNIVFKEDDYLNYADVFPLIENYIKSILSTHVVLFLGYSYNDINLKMIIQWIKNKINIRPEMFLVTFSSAANQIGYLKRNGITTIILSDINNQLPDIDNLDQYSKILYTFLHKIITGIDDDVLEKFEDMVFFIHSKLALFDGLNGILLEQIQKLFTNCSFEFDADSLAVLRFNNEALTGDYNREIRDVYMRFIELLNFIANGESPSDTLIDVFKTFSKCGIKGIFLTKNELSNQKQEYINFTRYIGDGFIKDQEKYLQFDYKIVRDVCDNMDEYFTNAFYLYNSHEIEQAYNLMESAILKCSEEGNYIKLFLAIFNRNVLLRRLKFDIIYREKYQDIYEINMEQRYFGFSKREQLLADPIYQFVNFSLIYQSLNTSIDYLDKVKKAKNTIDAGGFVYSNNINMYSGKLLNLLNFILSNKILIEDFHEIKRNLKNFIEIALLRRTQNRDLSLTKIEFFVCIRYISVDELKELFVDYYTKGSTGFGKLKIPPEIQSWLINQCFANCIEQYLNISDIENPFEHYIEKELFLIALSENNTEQLNTIFELINNVILQKRNTLTIFQSVNLFFGLQYNLYNTQINNDHLIKIIASLVNKIVNDEINCYEFYALANNHLSNLYGYMINGKAIFSDLDLIIKLLSKIKDYDIQSLLSITQNFLFKIYTIAKDNIKSKIKEFALGLDYQKEKELFIRILYELDLVIYDIKEFDEQMFADVSKFVEPFDNSNAFHSGLYAINTQIDYLINDKKIDLLKEISKIIKDCIERYKQSDKMSII